MARTGRPPNVARQQEMLRLRAQGLSYREVGEQLDPPVRSGTVATFFRRLRLKSEAATKLGKDGAGQ
jgi:DNA-binding NarL/FixJ family response regulator